MNPVCCHLALGSNLNDPVVQVRSAIQHLQRYPGIDVVRCSHLYRSPAWGVTEQADFINAVVQTRTTLPPETLLAAVKFIEYTLMGRTASARWHARCIDIDLLLYDRVNMDSEALTLPHRWLAERCFVLVPLLQLQPTLPDNLQQRIEKFMRENDCRAVLHDLGPVFN